MSTVHSESDFDLKSEDNHTFASRIISTLAKDTIERRVKAYELHKATLEKEASIRDPPGLEPMAEIDPHNLRSDLPYTMLRSAVPHQGEAAPLDDQIDTWYGSIYSARAWCAINYLPGSSRMKSGFNSHTLNACHGAVVLSL